MNGTVMPMPKGWRVVEACPDNSYHYMKIQSHVQAILSSPVSAWEDGRSWWHLSVSTVTGRAPTVAELRDAKIDFLGDRYAVMVFPSRDFYVHQVGVNPNVLHLWATDDEWPLPEFGKEGTL